MRGVGREKWSGKKKKGNGAGIRALARIQNYKEIKYDKVNTASNKLPFLA